MNKKLRLALIAPLAGLMATWSLFMVAHYFELAWDYNYTGLKWTVYLYLAGIVIVALKSGWAFRVADVAHASGVSGSRSVYRFTGLAVVLSLVAGAVFALGTFMSSFGSVWTGANKFLEVYLPIILVTAVVVLVLLSATVYRKSEAEPGAPADPRKKALGLAWSLPIIGTALALIIGMMAYGGQQKIQSWVWVFIQSIILVSIVLGTHFAVKARAAVRVAVKEKVVGAGALNLNFVLSIVFGAVVLIMAFSMGMAAFDELRDWTGMGAPVLRPVTASWLIQNFVPALLLLLLAEIGTYLTITFRNKEVQR